MIPLPDTPYPLTDEERRAVSRLLQGAPRTQIHYDWRTIEEWLPHPNLCGYVTRYHSMPQAFLGATTHQIAEGPPVAWVRFMVPGSARKVDPPLNRLWEAVKQDLRERGVRQVAMLAMERWSGDFAQQWGFERANAVITLGYEISGDDVYPNRLDRSYSIREATGKSDLDKIASIDAAAFEPIWQYDYDTLLVAAQQASTLTLLENEGEAQGYQLSTQHGADAHLARLAVLPEVQGQRLGEMLVRVMIRFFCERGISRVTVNTQEDNIRSQRLYERIGFRRTGAPVPVWLMEL